MNMKPRILIVGTVPYNRKSTSRAFASYFENWDRDCLAQIFSNTKVPAKGHCRTLYQITDKRLLERRVNRNTTVGVVFGYDELPDEWSDTSLEVGAFYSFLYGIGSNHTPLTHLIRKWVWKQKYWRTDELDQWLDSFKPECVFLSFSDDFFISEIALYVAKRYDIPIISSIGDDYYFNTRPSISPVYHLYKSQYRKLIRSVFAHGGSAIYIGDKIRDKYNSEFNLKGETVYLTSEVSRKDFTPVNKDNPLICYFGNIGVGRNYSLSDIGTALGQINPQYMLHVYSNETDQKAIKVLANNPNVRFCGSIPYSDVKKKNVESDIVVLVEGFAPKDVEITRYSLSTKAADSLASGSNILVYGSPECGLIEYMESTGGAAVCSDKKNLVKTLRKLIEDENYQRANYIAAEEASSRNHTLEKSTGIFQSVVERAIEEYRLQRKQDGGNGFER